MQSAYDASTDLQAAAAELRRAADTHTVPTDGTLRELATRIESSREALAPLPHLVPLLMRFLAAAAESPATAVGVLCDGKSADIADDNPFVWLFTNELGVHGWSPTKLRTETGWLFDGAARTLDDLRAVHSAFLTGALDVEGAKAEFTRLLDSAPDRDAYPRPQDMFGTLRAISSHGGALWSGNDAAIAANSVLGFLPEEADVDDILPEPPEQDGRTDAFSRLRELATRVRMVANAPVRRWREELLHMVEIAERDYRAEVAKGAVIAEIRDAMAGGSTPLDRLGRVHSILKRQFGDSPLDTSSAGEDDKPFRAGRTIEQIRQIAGGNSHANAKVIRISQAIGAYDRGGVPEPEEPIIDTLPQETEYDRAKREEAMFGRLIESQVNAVNVLQEVLDQINEKTLHTEAGTVWADWVRSHVGAPIADVLDKLAPFPIAHTEEGNTNPDAVRPQTAPPPENIPMSETLRKLIPEPTVEPHVFAVTKLRETIARLSQIELAHGTFAVQSQGHNLEQFRAEMNEWLDYLLAAVVVGKHGKLPSDIAEQMRAEVNNWDMRNDTITKGRLQEWANKLDSMPVLTDMTEFGRCPECGEVEGAHKLSCSRLPQYTPPSGEQTTGLKVVAQEALGDIVREADERDLDVTIRRHRTGGSAQRWSCKIDDADDKPLHTTGRGATIGEALVNGRDQADLHGPIEEPLTQVIDELSDGLEQAKVKAAHDEAARAVERIDMLAREIAGGAPATVSRAAEIRTNVESLRSVVGVLVAGGSGGGLDGPTAAAAAEMMRRMLDLMADPGELIGDTATNMQACRDDVHEMLKRLDETVVQEVNGPPCSKCGQRAATVVTCYDCAKACMRCGQPVHPPDAPLPVDPEINGDPRTDQFAADTRLLSYFGKLHRAGMEIARWDVDEVLPKSFHGDWANLHACLTLPPDLMAAVEGPRGRASLDDDTLILPLDKALELLDHTRKQWLAVSRMGVEGIIDKAKDIAREEYDLLSIVKMPVGFHDVGVTAEELGWSIAKALGYKADYMQQPMWARELVAVVTDLAKANTQAPGPERSTAVMRFSEDGTSLADQIRDLIRPSERVADFDSCEEVIKQTIREIESGMAYTGMDDAMIAIAERVHELERLVYDAQNLVGRLGTIRQEG